MLFSEDLRIMFLGEKNNRASSHSTGAWYDNERLKIRKVLDTQFSDKQQMSDLKLIRTTSK